MTSEQLIAKGFVRDPETGGFVSPNHYRVKRAAGAQGHAEERGARTEIAPETKLPYPVFQKCQTVGDEAAEREAPETAVVDYLPGVSEVDGKGHPRFRVGIRLLISSNQRRDADGAVATILDCMVKAIARLRRLRGLDQGDPFDSRGHSPRRGRRSSNTGGNCVSKVPF